MPSDAVHGRSNAKRKTLTVATRTADPQMDQGRPKSTAYCSESERPISRSSLRPLHDEPEDALRLPSLHDPVPRLLLERLEVRHRARVGGEQLDRATGRDRLDRLGELHDRHRAIEAAAVEHRARGRRGGGPARRPPAPAPGARPLPPPPAARGRVSVLESPPLERPVHRAPP